MAKEYNLKRFDKIELTQYDLRSTDLSTSEESIWKAIATPVIIGVCLFILEGILTLAKPHVRNYLYKEYVYWTYSLESVSLGECLVSVVTVVNDSRVFTDGD